MFCPNCGSEVKGDAQFCEKCGTKLTDNKLTKSQTQEFTTSERVPDSGEGKKPSVVLLVLGYLFALLGGLIGIIIGGYLYSRNNSSAKFHGRNILIIAAIVIIAAIGINALALTQTTTTTPSTSSSSSSTPTGAVVLVINYSGDWSGAISDSSGTRSIDGSGEKTINLGNITGAVAANVQKGDSSSETLSVIIKQGGETLKSESTSSEYGVVAISDYI